MHDDSFQCLDPVSDRHTTDHLVRKSLRSGIETLFARRAPHGTVRILGHTKRVPALVVIRNLVHKLRIIGKKLQRQVLVSRGDPSKRLDHASAIGGDAVDDVVLS